MFICQPKMKLLTLSMKLTRYRSTKQTFFGMFELLLRSGMNIEIHTYPYKKSWKTIQIDRSEF